MTLSEFDSKILEFAETAPRSRGLLDHAVRSQLGITPTRYWQRLNTLIDDPAAHRAHPRLLNRLARLRERQQPWETQDSASAEDERLL